MREGDLVERFGRAGLRSVTGGAGPTTGAFYTALDDAGKATLRATIRASLPDGPFTLPARAWIALGTIPG